MLSDVKSSWKTILRIFSFGTMRFTSVISVVFSSLFRIITSLSRVSFFILDCVIQFMMLLKNPVVSLFMYFVRNIFSMTAGNLKVNFDRDTSRGRVSIRVEGEQPDEPKASTYYKRETTPAM